MSKSKPLLKSNIKSVVFYIASGLKAFLLNVKKQLYNPQMLRADDHYGIFNIVFIKGFGLLGKIINELDFDTKLIMSSEHAFK